VQGIERATSGGSGGGVKRKELMDSSMTMERRAGSDWNKYGTRIPLLGTRDQGEKSKTYYVTGDAERWGTRHAEGYPKSVAQPAFCFDYSGRKPLPICEI
jgi:hypothetical protein